MLFLIWIFIPKLTIIYYYNHLQLLYDFNNIIIHTQTQYLTMKKKNIYNKIIHNEINIIIMIQNEYISMNALHIFIIIHYINFQPVKFIWKEMWQKMKPATSNNTFFSHIYKHFTHTTHILNNVSTPMYDFFLSPVFQHILLLSYNQQKYKKYINVRRFVPLDVPYRCIFIIMLLTIITYFILHNYYKSKIINSANLFILWTCIYNT